MRHFKGSSTGTDISLNAFRTTLRAYSTTALFHARVAHALRDLIRSQRCGAISVTFIALTSSTWGRSAAVGRIRVKKMMMRKRKLQMLLRGSKLNWKAGPLSHQPVEHQPRKVILTISWTKIPFISSVVILIKSSGRYRHCSSII